MSPLQAILFLLLGLMLGSMVRGWYYGAKGDYARATYWQTWMLFALVIYAIFVLTPQ